MTELADQPRKIMTVLGAIDPAMVQEYCLACEHLFYDAFAALPVKPLEGPESMRLRPMSLDILGALRLAPPTPIFRHQHATTASSIILSWVGCRQHAHGRVLHT